MSLCRIYLITLRVIVLNHSCLDPLGRYSSYGSMSLLVVSRLVPYTASFYPAMDAISLRLVITLPFLLIPLISAKSLDSLCRCTFMSLWRSTWLYRYSCVAFLISLWRVGSYNAVLIPLGLMSLSLMSHGLCRFPYTAMIFITLLWLMSYVVITRVC